MNFAYDIEVLKAHPDIHISKFNICYLTILDTLTGEILGLQTTIIDILYTPTTFTTAEAEISFRTTEFNS